MNNYGYAWRWEKSKNIVEAVCFILKNSKEIKSTFINAPEDYQQDLRPNLYGILYDSLKILCESIKEHYGTPDRWSVSLVDSIYNEPEKADEILKSLESKDFVFKN
jgi:hypothetical protein